MADGEQGGAARAVAPLRSVDEGCRQRPFERERCPVRGERVVRRRRAVRQRGQESRLALDRVDQIATVLDVGDGLEELPTRLAEAGLDPTGDTGTRLEHLPHPVQELRDLLAEAEMLRAIPVTTRKDIVRIPPALRAGSGTRAT